MQYSGRSMNISTRGTDLRRVAPHSSRPSIRLHAITLEAPLFDGAANIQKVSLSDAEALYVSLSERANDSHVMMVLYAPWCKHCSSMEPEVRRLAKGLEHESELKIVALDCDSPATRYFAKHVLGTPSLPAFCIFPKNSRTFFKYKGANRDANSLLKFVNMVCNQSDDRLWQLSGLDSQEEKGSTRVVSISQNPDERVISAIGVPAELVPHVTIASRLAVGLALLAGTYFIIKARQQAASIEQEGGSAEVMSEVPRAELSPVQQLVSDIDVTIGKIWGVMLRLMKARVGLALAPLEDEEPAAKTLTPTKTAEESKSLSSPMSSPSLVASSSAVPLPPLPTMSKPNVSAEEVLAMLEQDGGDVGKTIDRMMTAQRAATTPKTSQ